MLRKTLKIETVSTLTPTRTIYKSKSHTLKTPFICPTCGDVWQPKDANKGKVTLHDFPKIGCHKKPCLKCKLYKGRRSMRPER